MSCATTSLELLRGAKPPSVPTSGDIIRSLLASARDDLQLLSQLREHAGDAGSATWLTVLGRAVARSEITPEASHPRVATVAVVLLRNEYVTRGVACVPDSVLMEIVDELHLPLLRLRPTLE